MGLSQLLAALFVCGLATGAIAQKMRPDEAFWNAIRDTGDVKSFQLFVDTYPDSPYAAEAKKKLSGAAASAGPPAAAPKVAAATSEPPTFSQIVTAKDQQLLDLLFQSGLFKEGNWIGKYAKARCSFSFDWDEKSGPHTVRIISYGEKEKRNTIGYSNFKLEATPERTLTAIQEHIGMLTLKFSGLRNGNVVWRAWYQLPYPQPKADNIMGMNVYGGKGPGDPPIIYGCDDLVHASDKPARNLEPE